MHTLLTLVLLSTLNIVDAENMVDTTRTLNVAARQVHNDTVKPTDPLATHLAYVDKMIKVLTDDGGKVIKDEKAWIPGGVSELYSLTANSSAKHYHIVLFYHNTKEFDITGEFAYEGPGGMFVPFNQAGQTTRYVFLKIPSVAGKTGKFYFKEKSGKEVYGRLVVIAY